MNKRPVKIFGETGLLGYNLVKYFELFDKYEVIKGKNPNLLSRGFFNDLILPDNSLLIHSAGKVGGILDNMKNHLSYLSQNTVMGLNLIDYVQMNGTNINCFINIGSSCMYPKNSSFKEKDLFPLHSDKLEETNFGYGISKHIVMMAQIYLRNVRSFTVIPPNIVGYNMTFDGQKSHFIAAFIKKIAEAKLNNEKYVSFYGFPETRRELMDGRDVASAIEFLYQKYDPNKFYPINVGYGRDYTLSMYANVIQEALDWDGKIDFRMIKEGMPKKLLNVEKIDSMGWYPKHNVLSEIKNISIFYYNKINYNYKKTEYENEYCFSRGTE